jgi:hypothetical protein
VNGSGKAIPGEFPYIEDAKSFVNMETSAENFLGWETFV